MDCIFCKIIAGEIPSFKVYEDDEVIAFLDHTPTSHGHTLIVPKVHCNNLMDLPIDLASKIISVAQKIAPAIMTAVEAQGFNFSLNNGQVAGQVINHCHFHLIPRHFGDGLKLWSGTNYSEGEAQNILDKITKNL